MKFNLGKINVSFMITHRWQKGQNLWEKERWNDFRLGPRIRFWGNPRVVILLGFYLIVAKVWVTFSKSPK